MEFRSISEDRPLVFSGTVSQLQPSLVRTLLRLANLVLLLRSIETSSNTTWMSLQAIRWKYPNHGKYAGCMMETITGSADPDTEI